MQLLTSVVAYLGLMGLMYASISVSPLLALALAPLAGGFLVRTFIVFHDCTHGSFWPTKRGNEWVGRVCGLLTSARLLVGATSTRCIMRPPAI